ncbi:hypothetical protein GALMADRAFT_235192 [Galerina marginata CBS 339.88]|uniref:RING-type domain-containing protein n=1 Tax=Galerina marginata (strain CBS 339.88) TaxID=685588 RepID=A0A067U162_GALM3|nr:hypothetical protein GALMADRAFT_235192 [Galerina marginata CBS 339.88]
MDCQVCFEDLGDRAHCLPCGHIYCLPCISGLEPQRRSRNSRTQSIKCPECRTVVSLRICPENIRRIFLNLPSPSPETQTPSAISDRQLKKLEVELAKAKDELRRKDGEIQELGRQVTAERSPSAVASTSTSTTQEERPEHLRTSTGNVSVPNDYPQNIVVPECTTSDGYHSFSKKGSNQHATKYTCTNCRFSCSERRQQNPARASVN